MRQELQRPVFLSFARIRFPVGAVASIGHRISGVVLVMALPLAVLFLERSLQAEAQPLALPGWVRLPAALLAWAAAHPLTARFRACLTTSDSPAPRDRAAGG
jgi:succinate dehydrogenase / fumarate reductase, cytochrome b subunit